MNREEYEKLYETEPDNIELSDTDIIEWLDNIVEALKRLNECRYSLYYGKLNREEGEYEKHIELCSNGVLRIHVYDGIDTLATIVGCELKLIDRSGDDDDDDDYPYEYYFTYKGAYVFQLNKKPLDGEVSK